MKVLWRGINSGKFQGRDSLGKEEGQGPEGCPLLWGPWLALGLE